MAETLRAMPEVARLSERVTRILGSNPGKFTLQGTNTYLVSRSRSQHSSSILIDTGEGEKEYVTSLERVLRGQDSEAGPSKRWISDIILTHRHHDHVGGLPSVLALLARLREEQGDAKAPRLHKFPDPDSDPTLLATLKDLPAGSFSTAADSSPLHPLKHGDVVSASDATGEEDVSQVRVIHSPGHTADHICLLLLSENALFTADNVLGQGSSVFEDLRAYLRSLQVCRDALEEAGPSTIDGVADPNGENRLYPGHGPIVENGKATHEQYAAHRLEREAQIVELLGKPVPASSEEGASTEQHWTVLGLVEVLYAAYPKALHLPAARGVYLHLLKLQQDAQQGTNSNTLQVVCLDADAGLQERAAKMGEGGPVSQEDLQKLVSQRWALASAQSEPESQAASGRM